MILCLNHLGKRLVDIVMNAGIEACLGSFEIYLLFSACHLCPGFLLDGGFLVVDFSIPDFSVAWWSCANDVGALAKPCMVSLW